MVVQVTMLTKPNIFGTTSVRYIPNHGINHEINQRLTEYDAENTAIMLAHRYQFAVSVQLSRCSCCHSDAQQHGLLQDEHQHTRKNRIAVSHGGIEYRNFIEFQWMGGNFIVSIRESSTFRNLNARVDMACHTLCRLVNRLIGKHQTHIAINAHMCLFATVQLGCRSRQEYR